MTELPDMSTIDEYLNKHVTHIVEYGQGEPKVFNTWKEYQDWCACHGAIMFVGNPSDD